MRVRHHRYRSHSGTLRETNNYYVIFTDHLGRGDRRLPLPRGVDKRLADSIALKVQALVSHRIAREPLTPELMKWLENTPVQMRQRLLRMGILDAGRASVSRPLLDHVEDFRHALERRRKTTKDVGTVIQRVTDIVEGCQFAYWSDITAEGVDEYLQTLREGDRKLAVRTSNHFLTAIKSFCEWMVANKRATDNPLTPLESLHVSSADEVHAREPLTTDEVKRLLAAAAEGPARFGMSGEERALLYRFAIETGLRANAIRMLTVESIDFDKRSVTLKDIHSKNRAEVVAPLRGALVAALRTFTANRTPKTKLFGGSYRALTPETAEMLRQDLAATEKRDTRTGQLLMEAVPAVTASGKHHDFHALRHTGYTWLESHGVPRKVIADIFGQKTLKMGDIYSHPEWFSMRDAVDKFIEFDKLTQADLANQAKRTGTDGE